MESEPHRVADEYFPTNTSKPILLNQEEAKAVVLKLMNDLGFDALDAGALDEFWRQQPGTPGYGTDHNSEGVRRALSEASSQRPAEFQATDESPGTCPKPALKLERFRKLDAVIRLTPGDRAIQSLGLGLAGLVGS